PWQKPQSWMYSALPRSTCLGSEAAAARLTRRIPDSKVRFREKCMMLFHCIRQRANRSLAVAARYGSGAYNRSVMPHAPVAGSFSFLSLFDAGDKIRLDEVRRLIKAPPAGREPTFRQPAPEYVQFANPPVVEMVREAVVAGAEPLAGRIAYYDYGVVSLRLE